MKKIIIAIVILIIVGFGTYYIVFNKNSGGIFEYAPPASNNEGVTVDIKNFSFNPSTLTVKTGTKVTWTNNDGAPHTIVSDSNNLFSSPTLFSGQSFSFIFTNSGGTNYHCGIHPTMKGKIIVQD